MSGASIGSDRPRLQCRAPPRSARQRQQKEPASDHPLTLRPSRTGGGRQKSEPTFGPSILSNSSHSWRRSASGSAPGPHKRGDNQVYCARVLEVRVCEPSVPQSGAGSGSAAVRTLSYGRMNSPGVASRWAPGVADRTKAGVKPRAADTKGPNHPWRSQHPKARPALND